MLDSAILEFLEEKGIDTKNNKLTDLVSAFRLGFENGWWLSMDDDIEIMSRLPLKEKQ